MESGFLKRYLLHEIQNINSSNVKKRKRLSTLLEMDPPVVITADGNNHRFEKAVLEQVAEKLRPEMLGKVLLPINFYYNTSCSYCYYISDVNTYEMFTILGDMDKGLQFQEGKLWFYKHIGNRIRKKYPGLIQIVVMPVFSQGY